MGCQVCDRDSKGYGIVKTLSQPTDKKEEMVKQALLPLPEAARRFFKLCPNFDISQMSILETVVYFLNVLPCGFDPSFLGPEWCTALESPSLLYPDDPTAPISAIIAESYKRRLDLQENHKLKTPEGRRAIRSWWVSHGDAETYRTNPFLVRHEGLSDQGVNLLGFANAKFGIGEVLRLTQLALEAKGIPCEVGDTAHATELVIKFGINVFCMPGMENYKLLFKYGRPLFDQTYNVGYWPWELSEWPSELKFCFESVDEIWALSTFNRDSLQKSTDKKVFCVPLASPPAQVADHDRAFFELDQDRFYFLNIFDFNSSMHRKNPLATVLAFLKAFQKDEKVGLIFKTLNLHSDNPLCKEFLDVIHGDERIKILDRELPRESLAALIKLSDSYVSLHRAEGFGLPITEAMMLEKPVIVTAYSGNMDFTSDDNSYLVKYNLVPVRVQQYHFAEPGNEWAEPDTTHAALRMLEVFHNPSLARQKARVARETIESRFSPEAVGKIIEERLNSIRKSRES